jgi:hypothetical protein
MSGVGKVGLGILLLILCVPAAARLSRRPGSCGQQFSLCGWLMRVGHQRPVPRGTQRRSPRNPNEPLNPVVEQENGSDTTGSAAAPAGIIHQAVPIPAFIFASLGADRAVSAPNPEFLCTFLI